MALSKSAGLRGAKRTVLIVEDNILNREMLRAILEDDFNVLEAEDGLDGLKELEQCYADVSIVLLDVYMPNCDGFEFLRRKREDKRFDSIPVIVTTASDACEDEIKCLRLGANDFVVKPYNFEIIFNRITNTIRLRESAAIVNQLMWDDLTGLYTSEFFYRRTDDILAGSQGGSFDIACCEIVNFKMLIGRYGKKNCDGMLRELAKRIEHGLPGFMAGGRIGNESFAVIMQHQGSHEWTHALGGLSKGLMATNLQMKFGIVEEVESTLPASLVCSRALSAIDQIKDTFGTYVAWYNDELRQQQHREQVILESMEEALAKHEFTVHYQPKHELQTNKVSGAEALVRWIHPELGFVRPDHFIPLFEKNGFVTHLDLYVFERVCQEIQHCQEAGLPVIPISANLSRLDFDAPDLAAHIGQIADRYDVDHALVHIELTETAYSENPDRVISTLQELKRRGFVIELDDFGSGFSSLASLNVLPLDVMKLDMSLIRQAARLNDYRIVQSAIQMAGFLGLKTVAEGVETEEEAQCLQALGCNMIQGYYYSKPLSQQEFEEYLIQ